MANVRRYFRYDVIIPMHLEEVNRYGLHLGAERRNLISEEEEAELQVLNSALDNYLEKVFDASSNALYVFYVLNHKLDFMWWLLEKLMESKDPRLAGDYKFRSKEDSKFTPPKNNSASKIAPLILDLYQYIDDYISELQQVVENSIDGKIFTYPAPMKEHFNDQSYVTNLEFLPDQGVLPAKVLRLMVDKLNLQATVFDRLKTVYKQISRADEWTHYKVNLSAGGFSFLSEKSYDLFSRMDIFMGLDEDILICRGQVQSLTKSGNEIFPYRIGVMFELLTVEQQRKITLFEQRRELKDAMLSVALPF